MKKKNLRAVLCLLLAGTVLTAFAALAVDVGGQDDPLVTLSYLNGTYLNHLLDEVDEKLAARNRDILSNFSGAAPGNSGAQSGGAEFIAVTIPAGGTLRGSAGCEILFRSGGAVCADPAGTQPLADTTSGGLVSGGGALTANHLYLVLDSAGVQSAGGAELMVRGEYYIQ